MIRLFLPSATEIDAGNLFSAECIGLLKLLLGPSLWFIGRYIQKSPSIFILPVFLYGAETWSITKAIEKRIDAFDQWCLRRILNITWSKCVTNFEVRLRTGQPLLSDTVRIRRLKLFGHVARADKSQDHSRALRACISPAPRNWRRRPGRPRHT